MEPRWRPQIRVADQFETPSRFRRTFRFCPARHFRGLLVRLTTTILHSRFTTSRATRRFRHGGFAEPHYEWLYDVLAYGVVGSRHGRPGVRGPAIWQTSPPSEPDWSTLLSGGNIAYAPTAADEALTQAGEGFIGTMEFARRSIGLAFCRLANIDPASLDEATDRKSVV